MSDAKLAFIVDCLRGDEPMTTTCRRHGVSRQTGYVLLRRYRSEGPAGLEERSRAPHHHGRATAADVVTAIVAQRGRKPHWGAKKLLAVLHDLDPQVRWPAPSTVSAILSREGLSEPPRRRRRLTPVAQPFDAIGAANDTWCIDFKGWFRTGDGRRCDPFTASDAHSRYLLELSLQEPTMAAVDAAMERLFRTHGLPLAIRSDNGTPFASTGAGGLTRLSVRWAKLGIRLERIEPGQPQQNGRHERMHRTLQAEACQPPQPTARAQQRRFNEFRREYNHERPHEALGQQPPARFYAPSPRLLPGRIAEPAYDDDETVRRVRTSGTIKWRGQLLYLSEALVGEPVGLRETADGDWLVRFADVPLGRIDRHTGKLTRWGAGRPSRTPASPQS